jgi:hypothetical protein
MKQTKKPPSDQGDARINQEAIGHGLRRLFDDVVNEDVPDEFLELLKRADKRLAPGDPDLEGPDLERGV